MTFCSGTSDTPASCIRAAATVAGFAALVAVVGQAGCSSNSEQPGSLGGGGDGQGNSAGAAISAGGASNAAGNAGASATGGSASGDSGAGGSGTGGVAIAGDGGVGGAPAGKVPIFIAQGDAGRTTISCDDGKTWVANHAWDIDADPIMCGMKQSAVCYMSNCSYTINGACKQMQCCNDTPDVAKGVAFGNGQFLATWGWGQPGSVRRSTNGIDWTSSLDNVNENSFGGLVFGGGHFVLASPNPRWSADGVTWTKSAIADFRNSDNSKMSSVRRFGYGEYMNGGRFVAVATGMSRDMMVSSDGGLTWWRPKTIPDNCAREVSTYGGIVAGNGILVIVDQAANACRSTDGGETWSVFPTGVTEVLSHGLWTGTEFRFWGSGNMLSSADGMTWTKTPMKPAVRIGPVALGASGTIVAVRNVWEGYDQQLFLRTTDGITWESLPKTAFAPSHSVFYMTFGYADPSTACPAH